MVDRCSTSSPALFWLPVVWMQMRLRDLATAGGRHNQPLPDAYYRIFLWWCAFGVPAFISCGDHLLADDRKAAAVFLLLAVPACLTRLAASPLQ